VEKVIGVKVVTHDKKPVELEREQYCKGITSVLKGWLMEHMTYHEGFSVHHQVVERIFFSKMCIVCVKVYTKCYVYTRCRKCIITSFSLREKGKRILDLASRISSDGSLHCGFVSQ